jgi:hypothetical protein
MRPKCYFCDTELTVVGHVFRIGMMEEPVCEACFVKSVNRRKAKEQDTHDSAGPV